MTDAIVDPAPVPVTDVIVTSEAGGAVETFSDPAEEKRQKRMKRNRESAAQSRNRKQQYLDSLENEVKLLKEKVSALEAELEEVGSAIVPPAISGTQLRQLIG